MGTASADTVVFPGAVTAPLVVVQGGEAESLICAATQDRYIRAWTWEGVVAWEINVGRRVRSLLEAPDGTIVAVGTRGEVIRITPEGTVASRLSGPAALAEGTVEIDLRGNLRALAGRQVTAAGPSGRLLWSTVLPDSVVAGTVSAGRSWYQTESGALFSISADVRGERLPLRAGPPALVPAPGGSVLFVDDASRVVLSAGSGSNTWNGTDRLEVVPIRSTTWGFAALHADGTVQLFDWAGGKYGRSIGPVDEEATILVAEGGSALVVGRAGVVRIDAEGARTLLSRVSDGSEPWLGGGPPVAAALSADGAHLVIVDDSWRAEFITLEDAYVPVPMPTTEPEPDETSGDRSGAFLTAALNILAGEGRRERAQLLQQIDDRLGEGRLFSTLADVTTVLGRIALEPYRHPLRRRGVVVNDYPEIRLRAVRLLAAILDEPSRRLLMECAQRDPEAAVAGAALGAIATYGYDKTGAAVQIAGERFSRSSLRDRELLAPAVVRVGAMAGSGPAGLALLQAVSTSDVARETRLEAMRLMRGRM